jgi:hypothetical protein
MKYFLGKNEVSQSVSQSAHTHAHKLIFPNWHITHTQTHISQLAYHTQHTNSFFPTDISHTHKLIYPNWHITHTHTHQTSNSRRSNHCPTTNYNYNFFKVQRLSCFNQSINQHSLSSFAPLLFCQEPLHVKTWPVTRYQKIHDLPQLHTQHCIPCVTLHIHICIYVL